jgi:D-alanine-D-alanine ligase
MSMDRKDGENGGKIKALLLFGGESSEHEVSIASATNVYAAIDKERFDVVLGYIDREGRWWLVDKIVNGLPGDAAQQLMPQLGTREFTTASGSLVVSPDVLLPILHGKNGEDGSVQGLGQLLHIPVVGCDMTASAICMDKVATKEILTANGIPNVPYKIHRIGEADLDYKTLTEELGEPLFIKPARAGSSVGVSKVTTAKQFADAVRLAHEHDAVVLIEKGITGRELEVAALGNPPHHEVSGVGEIVAGDEFYSYDAKYSTDSTSQTIIPADLDDAAAEQIRSVAHRAYAALGCQGMARIDFFLDETGAVYLNEVNTIPGFTNISMYPKLWQEKGVSYTELITRLISLAVGDTIRTV